ncbi:MAG: hypothetical protein RI580_06645 [Halothece sp. Uz-M2-17]|nr:hypothetical protein [Halothece sp. Uz-M2-17]
MTKSSPIIKAHQAGIKHPVKTETTEQTLDSMKITGRKDKINKSTAKTSAGNL